MVFGDHSFGISPSWIPSRKALRHPTTVSPFVVVLGAVSVQRQSLLCEFKGLCCNPNAFAMLVVCFAPRFMVRGLIGCSFRA